MKAIEELESSISTVCNMLARDDSPPRNEIAALLRKNFTDAREELEAHKEVVEAAFREGFGYGEMHGKHGPLEREEDESWLDSELHKKLNNDKATNE